MKRKELCKQKKKEKREKKKLNSGIGIRTLIIQVVVRDADTLTTTIVKTVSVLIDL